MEHASHALQAAAPPNLPLSGYHHAFVRLVLVCSNLHDTAFYSPRINLVFKLQAYEYSYYYCVHLAILYQLGNPASMP